MRTIALQLAASALCVCCVLPSFDAVDKLPGEGKAGESSMAGSSSGMAGNSSTTATMGGKSGTAGSEGSGAEGGDPSNGGKAGSSGVAGADAMSGAGGTSGSGGTGSGGTSGSGGLGGNAGSDGTGGLPSAACSRLCSGADSIVVVCADEASIDSSLKMTPTCLERCAKETTASKVACWQTHVTNFQTIQGPHCQHAGGLAPCTMWPSL